MTEKEFLTRTHFMTDACGVIPAATATRDGGGYRAVVYGSSQTARGERYKAAAARLEKVCRDAQIAAKLDRVSELIDRIAAARNRPIPDAEDAGPSAWELMAGYQPSAGELAARYLPSAEEQARICAESETAYAARNPHKRKTIGGYEGEDSVTAPAGRFSDAAGRTMDAARISSFEARCRASEAAYAARNPHKKGTVQP